MRFDILSQIEFFSLNRDFKEKLSQLSREFPSNYEGQSIYAVCFSGKKMSFILFSFYSLFPFSGFAWKSLLVKFSFSGPLGSIPRTDAQKCCFQLIYMNFAATGLSFMMAFPVPIIFKEISLQTGYV